MAGLEGTRANRFAPRDIARTQKEIETTNLVDDIRLERAGKTAVKMDEAENYPVPNRKAKGDREQVAAMPLVIESEAPDEMPAKRPQRPVSRHLGYQKIEQPAYGASRTQNYVAQKGDNITKIAKRHGVPVADVIAMNKQVQGKKWNPNKVRIGQVIALPTKEA